MRYHSNHWMCFLSHIVAVMMCLHSNRELEFDLVAWPHVWKQLVQTSFFDLRNHVRRPRDHRMTQPHFWQHLAPRAVDQNEVLTSELDRGHSCSFLKNNKNICPGRFRIRVPRAGLRVCAASLELVNLAVSGGDRSAAL